MERRGVIQTVLTPVFIFWISALATEIPGHSHPDALEIRISAHDDAFQSQNQNLQKDEKSEERQPAGTAAEHVVIGAAVAYSTFARCQASLSFRFQIWSYHGFQEYFDCF